MSTDDQQGSLANCQRKLAVDLFNLTWELMDKPDRTPEDDDRMIHAAHASRFLWGEIGEPLNWQRGEWLVSRVYAVLGRTEAALHHARRCLELTEQHGIGGLDRAFAYEAVARALSIADRQPEAAGFMQRARVAAERIEKQEDREYVEGELKTIPGWGG